MWWQAASAGVAEQLTTPAAGERHVPEAWSRDGTRLLLSVVRDRRHRLSVFTLAGRRLEPFGTVESTEPLSATFSPDGRWVAYAYTERPGGAISPDRGVFVSPYPATGERHQAPKRLLDYHPVWTPDGAHLLYVPGSNRPLVSVPITTSPAVSFGPPVDLPQAPLPGLLSLDVRGYDMMPDGRVVSVAPWTRAGQPGASGAISASSSTGSRS